MIPRLYLQARLLSRALDLSPTYLLDNSTWSSKGLFKLSTSKTWTKTDPIVFPTHRPASLLGFPDWQPCHPHQKPGSHLPHPHILSVTKPRKYLSVSFSPSLSPQHLSPHLLLGPLAPLQVCLFHSDPQSALSEAKIGHPLVKAPTCRIKTKLLSMTPKVLNDPVSVE